VDISVPALFLIAQLSGLPVERVVVDEGEGLVPGLLGIGVDIEDVNQVTL
jgi:hypothetical protein